MNKDIAHERATALVRAALADGEKRGMQPAIITRECVIDLLARVVRLERAFERIKVHRE